MRLGVQLALLGLLLPLLAGCGIPRFGFPEGVTPQADRMLSQYQGASIAALAVGALVWGLILWACFAYRKRSDEMPRQVRYNVPIEVLYTVLPFVIVAGLFYYTVRDEIYVNELSKDNVATAGVNEGPELVVGVEGFRWNWAFRYVKFRDVNTNVEVVGQPVELPVLVLPADTRIRFVLSSPDVMHSFWVPDFLFKRDVIPGRLNQFEITDAEPGEYIGRCAELCGVDHTRMNFIVRVIPKAEFDKFLAERNTAATAASGQAASTTGSSS